MAEVKLPDTQKIMSVVSILAVIVVIFVVYKIMTGLGLIKTGAKKKAEAEQKLSIEELRTTDYFNPEYYKDKFFKKIGVNLASDLAHELRKATRGIGTNEEMIYSAFSKLDNKVNISEVAEQYQLHYKTDLRAKLLDELSDKEKVILNELINKLPNG
jgi:hypothetical protein